MTRIIFPEFRDEQGDSRYPFSDTATLRSNTGFFIPKNCFVDAHLYPIGGGAGAYLSSISVANDRVTINFSDPSNTNACTGIYRPLDLGENKHVSVALLDSSNRPAGVFVGLVSELRLLSGWPIGTHTFTPAATELVGTAVSPAQEPGVRGLIGPSGELLTDDLWLIGDRGVVLRVLAENTIQVNIVGTPLFKRAECVDSAGNSIGDFSPRNYLKTINGCEADEYGNFNLAVKSHNDDGTIRKQILRIYPDENGLKIAVVGSRVL
jgi:hypothetical protein